HGGNFQELRTPGHISKVKYWEIIADNLSKVGWTWGYCTITTASGSRYIVDAHRGDLRSSAVQICPKDLLNPWPAVWRGRLKIILLLCRKIFVRERLSH